jgi:hypothetical protein
VRQVTVRTFDLNEAASFISTHPQEVRNRAKRGVIPGARTSRRWVFLEADLAEFVRLLQETQNMPLGPNVEMADLARQVRD